MLSVVVCGAAACGTPDQENVTDNASAALHTESDGRKDDRSEYVAYVSGYGNNPIDSDEGTGIVDINVFDYNIHTGALTRPRLVPAGVNPTYLAFGPRNRFLYALQESKMSKVLAFAIDGRTGDLTKLAKEGATAPGASSAHISVHPSGRWLFVAHFGTNQVTVHALAPNGDVSDQSQIVTPGMNPHQVVIDRSGRHVFVPCYGSDWVASYTFENGKLTPNATQPTIPLVFAFTNPDGSTNTAPRHMVFHPSEKYAYVLTENGGNVSTFDYNEFTGHLTNPTHLSLVPPPQVENWGAHIVINREGTLVFTSNRGHHGSLSSFAVNRHTGRLTLVANTNGGGIVRQPRDFTLDPSERHLLVANENPTANNVATFAIAPDGALTPVGTPVTVIGPSFVGVIKLR